ncbi:uncharacterized protein (TIGR02646 family) [Rhodobacter sp. JA431]|uniref:endonuclease n=1 Tax=Rhodobacter sp. JA431 TaxID=570013 RepID=UPI000BD95820|nr:endonuclease [Rhodobacter sp. JA431]SOC05340.1 uncharacterized protein (TIGR02646 family) [Rhodobacter sp. JA431]
MRQVERTGPVPKAMNGPESAAARERAKAAKHVAKARAKVAAGEDRPKTYGFKIYKDEAVKLALTQLFHGKCAYCESDYAAQAPVDIEHYRPKGGVEDDPDHFGYWWLAADWENLLPSCIDCNRRRYQILPTPETASLAELDESAKPIWQTGKENAFPVFAGTRAYGTSADPFAESAAERPYLLDPCRDDPRAHLRFLVDAAEPLGLVVPKALDQGAPDALPLLPAGADIAPDQVPPHVSARGAVSIQVYGLNRLGLVQARTRILRHLALLEQMILEADALSARLGQSPDPGTREAAALLDAFADRLIGVIRTMAEPDQPYSEMVCQWIDHWLREMNS